MPQVSKTRIEELKDKAKSAAAKYRELRGNRTTMMLARVGGAVGAGAAASGKMDGLLNVIPGGHLGHSDYTKGPNGLMYTRFLAMAASAAASAYFFDGPEGSVITPTAAAMAGSAYRQHLATYYGVTGALSADQLSKDLGAVEAAKVAAAKGYPQV